ncbi:MAG TPA: tRNA (adenosine(37)-N6)-threonylcarbamoyltransferase complex ATPase subunit type 1 TsaE, partial [Candidatus Hydrogenedentes bacterium]|nr:tRNA (adenosine(37)-N6)-threonylcarbamoyltransferase complex ATPase subunit type 1 TsaE [Candidatus Hydrogenedentota bacterium]
GYEELFEPDGVCVVEWAERADGLLPERRVEVRIEHAGQDVRRIRMQNHGALSTGWEDSLLRDE